MPRGGHMSLKGLILCVFYIASTIALAFGTDVELIHSLIQLLAPQLVAPSDRQMDETANSYVRSAAAAIRQPATKTDGANFLVSDLGVTRFIAGTPRGVYAVSSSQSLFVEASGVRTELVTLAQLKGLPMPTEAEGFAFDDTGRVFILTANTVLMRDGSGLKTLLSPNHAIPGTKFTYVRPGTIVAHQDQFEVSAFANH